MEYVVLDLETTGLSRNRHRITEIGAVLVRRGAIAGGFQRLINPHVHIPSFISRLTGIDDELVKDADPIERVLPEFMGFLGDRTIVAHNAGFDHGFLLHNAKTLDLDFENDSLCTRRLAHRLLPGLASRRLACVCAHLGIPHEHAHRAMPDVIATHEVFLRLQKLLSVRGLRKLEDFHTFQELPLADTSIVPSAIGPIAHR